jgi:membrane protease YdiL (CAAX protease family)
MNDERWHEMSGMLFAYAIISGIVVLGLVLGSWFLVLRPRFPSWKLVPFRGTLLDWFVLTAVYFLLVSLLVPIVAMSGVLELLSPRYFPPMQGDPVTADDRFASVAGGLGVALHEQAKANANQLRVMLASVLTLPCLVVAIALYRIAVYQLRPTWNIQHLPRDIAFGACFMVLFTPVVLVVHFATILVSESLGLAVTSHNLANLGFGASWGESLLFIASACIAVPAIEELLFRGILLRWAAAKSGHATLVLLAACVVAWAIPMQLGPAFGFAVLMSAAIVGGLSLLSYCKRFPLRTMRSVLVTALLFAVFHASIWPTPIPLFVLGCGLGYLVVRTGRVMPAIVFHALFNGVSTLYLALQSH